MAHLSVRGLAFRYPPPQEGGDEVVVLDGLDLEVASGEHVVVAGRSGSGKTTLLSLLGGLEPVQEGTVEVDGLDLGDLDGDGLAAHRRDRVGFVFQHFGLLDTLTAQENVELAASLTGAPATQRRERARELLDAVGLDARRSHRPPALSGGERQRVAVARALVNRPGLVLADEPTGNLDDESGALVGHLLTGLPGDHGCTVVVATHDPALIADADRSLHLARGALV